MSKRARADGVNPLVFLLFGWFWIPKPDVVCAPGERMDKRFRTTGLAYEFWWYATKILAVNALLLIRAYVAVILQATHTTFESEVVPYLFPQAPWHSLVWSIVQAQLAAVGLFTIYYKIVKVAESERRARAM